MNSILETTKYLQLCINVIIIEHIKTVLKILNICQSKAIMYRSNASIA